LTFRGPVRNGGVGTAFTSLAEALVARATRSPAFYLGGQWCENQKLEIGLRPTIPTWICPLPPPEGLRLGGTGQHNRAYEAFLWLRDRQSIVIHFSSGKGRAIFA